MTNELKMYNRKNIRLKYYNYSQEGNYFVTICTQNRKCILAKINKTDVGAGLVPQGHVSSVVHFIHTADRCPPN